MKGCFMHKRRMLILSSCIVVIGILLVQIYFPFNRKVLDFSSYTLNQIDVRSDSISIVGDVGGASGLGQDGYTYFIQNNKLYIKIYQQSMFPSKPLNGRIQIRLDGDFAQLTDIYIFQPKNRSVNIWSLAP